MGVVYIKSKECSRKDILQVGFEAFLSISSNYVCPITILKIGTMQLCPGVGVSE